MLDLKAWYLTLPTGAAGHPDTVENLDGIDNPFCKYVDDALVFQAPCGGVTTANSKYPRSELRELGVPHKAGFAWSFKAHHSLEVTLAVTHLPVKKPQVVCMQIHGPVTKVVMIELDGKTLQLVDAKGAVVRVLDANYTLGKKTTLKMQAGDKKLIVSHDGVIVATHTQKSTKAENYFKTGCYTQSNAAHGDAPDAYGEVHLYAVKLE